MKKRIGSKLYNTESSEFVASVGAGDLYRKKTRSREWFMVSGKNIEPLEEPKAVALLDEQKYTEKPVDEKRIMVGIYRETHAIIARLAKADNVKIADEIKTIVDCYISVYWFP